MIQKYYNSKAKNKSSTSLYFIYYVLTSPSSLKIASISYPKFITNYFIYIISANEYISIPSIDTNCRLQL